MNWLHLSDAQLTAPVETVCSGQPVLFLCQQLSASATWIVNIPGLMLRVLAPRAVGELEMFPGDPGYAFEVTTTALGNGSIVSELRVTAVRELDGVTVNCEGFSGMYMSEIQVAAIGESHVEIILRDRYFLVIKQSLPTFYIEWLSHKTRLCIAEWEFSDILTVIILQLQIHLLLQLE